MNTLRSVAVFAGSSSGAHPAYAASAWALGRFLAEQGVAIIYGGASVGLMGCVADAALAAGGRVVGVLPRALADLELAHKGLSELKIVDSMHERKMAMADAADAFIAMPGGLGTIEEIFEVWTWSQLGVHSKPIGFLDVDGYFAQLLAFLDHSVAQGFVKAKHRAMAAISASPEELLKALSASDVSYEAKWIDKPKP